MKDVTPRRRRRRSPLIAGLILIVVGAVLLSVNLGYGVPLALLQYYPVVLLALGLIGVVVPSRHLQRSTGIWLLASGIYCAISEFNLFDLGWGSAWPIFIVAYGIQVIFSVPFRDCGHRGAGDRADRGTHEA